MDEHPSAGGESLRSPNPPVHPPGPEPRTALADRAARRQAEEQQRAAADAAFAGQAAVWQAALASPVAAMVPEWVAGWQAFGTALVVADLATAASWLERVAGLTTRLDRLHADWAAANRRWFDTAAARWNADHPGHRVMANSRFSMRVRRRTHHPSRSGRSGCTGPR